MEEACFQRISLIRFRNSVTYVHRSSQQRKDSPTVVYKPVSYQAEHPELMSAMKNSRVTRAAMCMAFDAVRPTQCCIRTVVCTRVVEVKSAVAKALVASCDQSSAGMRASQPSHALLQSAIFFLFLSFYEMLAYLSRCSRVAPL